MAMKSLFSHQSLVADPIMPAILLDNIFNPWDYGATATFVGTMRDFNINETVSHMTLEHYPAMTQHYLDTLCSQSIENYDLDDCLVIHRFGDIHPGEPIVLTAAWSAHRAQAFDACRYLMEELKARAPLWKKEVTADGERWVHNDQQTKEE
jgi:molybdopterin synthase catalytic subunit